jgi:CRP-like cAMP-binding protein
LIAGPLKSWLGGVARLGRDKAMGPARRSMLLNTIPVDARSTLLRRSHAVRFDAGETIFSQGEPGDTMILIEAGRVEISLTSINGRRSVLNHMGPGEVLGEIALLDGRERSADATAATAVTGRLIYRRDVLSFLSAEPESVMHLISELCAKIRNASDMFAVQSETRAPARLARCLLRLGEKWGERDDDGRVVIAGSFSQSDIGAFSGLARENVNRHLRAWTAAGIMEMGQERILLLRPDALEELAHL